MIACAVIPASDMDVIRDGLAGYGTFAGESHRVLFGKKYALISGPHGAYYRIRRASRDKLMADETPDTALAPS